MVEVRTDNRGSSTRQDNPYGTTCQQKIKTPLIVHTSIQKFSPSTCIYCLSIPAGLLKFEWATAPALYQTLPESDPFVPSFSHICFLMLRFWKQNKIGNSNSFIALIFWEPKAKENKVSAADSQIVNWNCIAIGSPMDTGCDHTL